jgi:hypothetical protein
MHPKAMPVLLTMPADEALRLQRPLLDESMTIVAWGKRRAGWLHDEISHRATLSAGPRRALPRELTSSCCLMALWPADHGCSAKPTIG